MTYAIDGFLVQVNQLELAQDDLGEWPAMEHENTREERFEDDGHHSRRHFANGRPHDVNLLGSWIQQGLELGPTEVKLPQVSAQGKDK